MVQFCYYLELPKPWSHVGMNIFAMELYQLMYSVARVQIFCIGNLLLKFWVCLGKFTTEICKKKYTY